MVLFGVICVVYIKTLVNSVTHRHRLTSKRTTTACNQEWGKNPNPNCFPPQLQHHRKGSKHRASGPTARALLSGQQNRFSERNRNSDQAASPRCYRQSNQQHPDLDEKAQMPQDLKVIRYTWVKPIDGIPSFTCASQSTSRHPHPPSLPRAIAV